MPQSVIDAIIKDAQDGTIDGNWTAAQIRATLAFIQNNPVYQQYSDLEGVLEDYLASLQAPGEQGGQLAFTGGEVFLILAAGLRSSAAVRAASQPGLTGRDTSCARRRPTRRVGRLRVSGVSPRVEITTLRGLSSALTTLLARQAEVVGECSRRLARAGW